MIKIRKLIWDKWNINHITKHNVTKDEIEELCNGKHKKTINIWEKIFDTWKN